MKRIATAVSPVVMLMAATIALFSCGGGGGGGGAASQPTTAVLKLSTQGTLPSGAQIGGIDVTISLPAGVTVKNATNPPETDGGVVVAAGNASSNSTILSTYDAASHNVRVLLANSNGFGIGEYAAVNGDIAAGYQPTQADFSLTGIVVKDLNGASLNEISVAFTATIQ